MSISNLSDNVAVISGASAFGSVAVLAVVGIMFMCVCLFCCVREKTGEKIICHGIIYNLGWFYTSLGHITHTLDLKSGYWHAGGVGPNQ